MVTGNGKPLVWPTTVSYASANGTAVAGFDYLATSGTLSFPANAASGTLRYVPVTILDNRIPEPSETFTLHLSGPVNAQLGTAPVQTVTILDFDHLLFSDGFESGDTSRWTRTVP